MGKTNKRLFIFLNMCWIFESTSRQLFWLISIRNSQSPDATASCSCMSFPGCCPQSTQYFFLTDCAHIPELYLLYPPPPSIANVYSFKTTYIFLFQTHCIRVPSIPGRQTCLSSPPSPTSGGLVCMLQDLAVFLASVCLNKPFLSEKLLSSKPSFNKCKWNIKIMYIIYTHLPLNYLTTP